MAPLLTRAAFQAVHVLGTLAVWSLQRCLVEGASVGAIKEAAGAQLPQEEKRFFQDGGVSHTGTMTSSRPRTRGNNELSSPRSSRRDTKTQRNSSTRHRLWKNRSRSESAWAFAVAFAAVISSIWVLSHAIRGSRERAAPLQPGILSATSTSMQPILHPFQSSRYFSQHSGSIISAALITAAFLFLILYFALPSSSPVSSEDPAKTAASIPAPDKVRGTESLASTSPSAAAETEGLPEAGEPWRDTEEPHAASIDPRSRVSRAHGENFKEPNFASPHLPQHDSSQTTHLDAPESESVPPAHENASGFEHQEAFNQTVKRDLFSILAQEASRFTTTLVIGLGTFVSLLLGIKISHWLMRRPVRTVLAREEHHATIRQRNPLVYPSPSRDTQVANQSAAPGEHGLKTAGGLGSATGHDSSHALRVPNLKAGDKLEAETGHDDSHPQAVAQAGRGMLASMSLEELKHWVIQRRIRQINEKFASLTQ